MPGPGIELVGAEEAAEVMEVLKSGYLSRYGPSDDPAFGAKVHHVEQAIAKLTGVRYGLGLHGGGSAALWIALMSLGAWKPFETREMYLSLVLFHGWLELAAIAHLAVRR